MKVPTYPPLIVSIQMLASSKTKSNAVRASALTKMNVSAKLRPRRPPPSVSRTPKPARNPMQSLGRHAGRIVSRLRSYDHGGMPRRPGRLHSLLVPILANRRHEKSRVARKSCPTTKSSSSHPRLDDYGKETGRG